MKVLLPFISAALVWGNSSTLHGQETSPGKPAAQPAASPTTTTLHAAPPGPASTNSELVSIFSESTLRNLGIDPRARVVSVMTNRLDVVTGERTQMEGGLVPLIKRPSLLTFFQLFNPFAPAEFGGMGGGPDGQAFSRAFADPIKTQPTTALFSVGARPAKAVPTTKAGTN